MKALLVPFLLLLPLLGWGQIFHIDPATHKLAYSEVTEVDGTPKEEKVSTPITWGWVQFNLTTSSEV